MSFIPKKTKKNRFIPPIVINEYNNLSKKEKIERPLEKMQEIKIKYSDVFSLGFSALEFSNPVKNNYAYKFEGLHDNWINIGTQNKITFANVKPGNYVLKVKGSNSDGVWNEKGVSFNLIVTPPLWNTWYFRLLLSIIIIVISVFFYKKRIKHIKIKYNKLGVINYFCMQHKLSNREREVLDLILEGKTNKEMEEVLYVSYSTIRNHVYNIYQKTNVKSKGELILKIKSDQMKVIEEKK